MPYAWIEPQIFLEHGGITIYHSYNDDDWNRRLEYWYTVDITGNTCDLDIRDLPEYDKALEHEEVLRRAIDRKSTILMDALKMLDE